MTMKEWVLSFLVMAMVFLSVIHNMEARSLPDTLLLGTSRMDLEELEYKNAPAPPYHRGCEVATRCKRPPVGENA